MIADAVLNGDLASSVTPIDRKCRSCISARLRPAGTAGQILCPAVVGRDGLLATLLKRVAAARGDIVAVLGEAGIGKSRLLRKLERRAGEAGALVVGGRAVQGTQPAPYRPLARR